MASRATRSTPSRVLRITAVARGIGDEERIVAVGGVRPDGMRWRMTVEEAIAAIARGDRFYVEEPIGDPVDVVVSHTGRGLRYLRTVADADRPNNLLALPDLPPADPADPAPPA